MIRTALIILAITGISLSSHADHITGGEMYYTYVGFSNNQYQYRVTLKLFMRCNSGRNFPNPAYISVFDRGTYNRFLDLEVPISLTETISLQNPDPCITNPPPVCYEVAYYRFNISLPGSANGYVIASQVNYRIDGINNLEPGYNQLGATYSAEIPATQHAQNHSARFTGSDLVIVCAANEFSYSFAAEDNDGDQLRYSFCAAYASSGDDEMPPPPPPYSSVPYGPAFGSSQPLGMQVQLNTETGLITGIAPDSGPYVVTVCVEEVRNGNVIATQRKDVQINITSCTIAAASLPDEFLLCAQSMTLTLSNQVFSPLIESYNWDIFDASGNLIFQSQLESPAYSFPDTGIYSIKLAINRGQSCSDSATALARVYPGFEPAFSFDGICIQHPTEFTDNTTTVYGTVNSWSWDFGEPSLLNDISAEQNPSFTYPATGPKLVRLIAGNSNGCRDTVFNEVTIIDKPVIELSFRDTLICAGDQLQLTAAGSGNFLWSPAYQLTGSQLPNPLVSPLVTTTYFVNLEDDGCTNIDSVRVRVVSEVTLEAMADTLICAGDSLQLGLHSDALQYSWSPAQYLNDASLNQPTASVTEDVLFQVTGVIGGCSATASIFVQTAPYPIVNAGADTSICYGTAAFLNGTTNGNQFYWNPAPLLSNSTITNPIANTLNDTPFVFTATSNNGCPKPVSDTIFVAVRPQIPAFAGNDTVAVIGQPLQLNATGGVDFIWNPPSFLSDHHISMPVATFFQPFENFLYTVSVFDDAGCEATDSINIKVFATRPTVFVPTAFSPNGDGLNDLLRPIAVGMERVSFFIVFNRWGQKVFESKIDGTGWDGRIAGQLQSTGVYVWLVQAVDYNGNEYTQRGTVVLVR